MDYKSYKEYGNVIVAQRSDYLWGVLDHEGNEIVPFGKYGWIDGFDQGLARVRTPGNSGRVANTIAIIDLESDKAKVVEGRGNLEDFIRLDRAKHPETYAKWGADLTLSGHLHGGIMRLPILGGVIAPSYHLFPKYDAGLFRIGNQKMIVSVGLGSHSIKIRLFNPPKIDVITLQHEKKAARL